jgi:CheY-like chemotaxis protein
VVVLSADASPAQARRLLAAGALRYLTKPVDLHDVVGLLDEVAADAARGE